MAELGTVVALIKSMSGADPAVIEEAVQDWLDDHPEATTTVQDGSITEAKLAQDVLADLAEIETLSEAIEKLDPSATSGDVGKFLKAKTVSGGKVTEWELGAAGGGGSVDLFYVTPEDYGAVGDGVTDDTQAIQDAVDAGYVIRCGDNKTYLLTDEIVIDHDLKIVGGENTLFKNFQLDKSFFKAEGTKKTTTAMTTDYSSFGTSDNSGNRFTLSDMSEVKIGDILVVTAQDQYYSYSRQYYYLGGALLVSDVYNGHIYTSDSLPFDIENTEDVKVEIYSAPEVTFENINFMSNVDDRRMYFRYAIDLHHCKNSVVRNCNINQMDMSIEVSECVNTHIDCVTMSKSKALNDIESDGYGIFISSSTNTIVERVLSLCSQACLCLSGTIPNINTYIYNCDFSSECRGNGIGMHENAYNTVIEDCTLGGAGLYGTVTMNRCRIIKNNRPGLDTSGVKVYGSHDPNRAIYHFYDCVLDGVGSSGVNPIEISRPVPQNPVESFDNIVGEVIIKNCRGGTLIVAPTDGTSSGVLSNVIKRIEIDHWAECFEIYHTDDSVIEFLDINETDFIKSRWINKHSGDNFNFNNVNFISVKAKNPQIDKLYVDITKNGGSYVLPSGVAIAFTSNDNSAHYMVCGRNVASNDPADYQIGTVSGTAGQSLTFTANSDYASALSKNQSGNLVLTRPNKTTAPSIFPKFMLYVEKAKRFKMSVKLKNIGETSGQEFRPYILVLDADTRKILYKGNGSATTASADGTTVSFDRGIDPNCLVIGYLSMTTGVANAVTEISDFYMEAVEEEFSSNLKYEPYNGSSRIGDGSLTSIEGKNIIMCSPVNFSASFKVDRLDV